MSSKTIYLMSSIITEVFTLRNIKPDGSLYCPRYVLVFHAKTRILSNFICPRLTIARRQVGSGLTTALWSLMQDTESEGGRSTKITSMLHQWIGSCCTIRRLFCLLPLCPKSSYLFSFLLITKFEIWLSTQNGVEIIILVTILIFWKFNIHVTYHVRNLWLWVPK